MDDIRPAGLYTRRTALMMASAAIPLCSQSRKTTQTGGKDMAHPVVHFEIGCKDRAKTEQFFGELFGWQIQGGPASTIDTASHGRRRRPVNRPDMLRPLQTARCLRCAV